MQSIKIKFDNNYLEECIEYVKSQAFEAFYARNYDRYQYSVIYLNHLIYTKSVNVE